MSQELVNADQAREAADPSIPPRRGAIGKAFIVWLASGSLGIAVVAFLIFWAMGC